MHWQGLHLVALSWILAFLIFRVRAAQNVTIDNQSPQIIYTPFVCNATITDVNPSQCDGAWRFLLAPGTPFNTFASTNGPNPQAGSIIPQMFLNFRASAFYVFTSSFSNATVNLTLSYQFTEAPVNVELSSSVDLITAMNLSEAEVMSLAITFVPSELPTRLDIDVIILTVSDPTASSSFLPAESLPPSSSPPRVPTPTSSPHAHAKNKALAEGLGIGLGIPFFLLLSGAISFLFWQRRRRMARPRELQVISHKGKERAS